MCNDEDYFEDPTDYEDEVYLGEDSGPEEPEGPRAEPLPLEEVPF